MYENLAHDKYTPIEGKVRFTLDRLHAEMGSWGRVADAAGVKRRYFRRINRDRKTISMSLLDKILQGCGSATTVRDFPWYTTDELVERGIWKPTGDVDDGE